LSKEVSYVKEDYVGELVVRIYISGLKEVPGPEKEEARSSIKN